MFLQNSQRKIEEEFLKLTEKLGADREPLKTICEKLDGCGRDLGLAMKYLYVTAPYSDLVNYSFEEIQDFGTCERAAGGDVFELYSGSQGE